MDILKISALAIILAAVSLVIKKQQPELASVTAVFGGVLISLYILKYISPVVEEINRISALASIDRELVSIILKSAAVCIISSFSSECCRDCGEKSLAMKIDLSAKVIVLFMCIPLFTEIINQFSKLAEL